MPDLLNLGKLSKCYFTGDQIKATVRVKIPEKEEKRIKHVEISLRVQEQTKMRCKENSKMFEHKKTGITLFFLFSSYFFFILVILYYFSS